MRQVRIACVGVGNVARALGRLLADKRVEMEERYGVELLLCGVATRRHGFRLVPGGVGIGEVLGIPEQLAGFPAAETVEQWLAASRPEVLFELSSLNPRDGEPALSYVRAALRAGVHVVTANKGPVAYGYHELSALARQRNRKFLFEATCLAGAPFFSLFRETRPLCRLLQVRAIVNVMANLILREMAEGLTFEEGVKKTQDMGLAETDPSHDTDGWDAAVKISIVSQVLMGGHVMPQDVHREGIRGITPERLRAAAAAGKTIRLVARAQRNAGGIVTAIVKPEELAAGDTLLAAGPDGLIAECITDTTPPYVVAAQAITPVSTAYDVLADFITIVRRGVQPTTP